MIMCVLVSLVATVFPFDGTRIQLPWCVILDRRGHFNF